MNLVILGIATTLSLLVSSCLRSTPPLRLGTSAGMAYDNFYLAESLGYYEKQPIRLVNYPTSEDKSRAFRNHQVDALATSLGDALILADSDASLRNVLILSASRGGDAMLAQPSIHNLQELKGQTIGVEASGRGTVMLTRALEKAGLSMEDINVQPLDISSQIDGFKQKSVHAIVTREPLCSKLLETGAKDIFSSRQIPNDILNVLMVRSDTIIGHQLELEHLVQGWFQARHYYHQNPQDAAERLISRNQLSTVQLIEAMEGLREFSLEENLEMLSLKTPWLQESLKKVQEDLVQNHALRKLYRISDLVSNQIIRDLSPIN